MSGVFRGLPEGRALRQGNDAYANQIETDNLRAKQNPVEGEYAYHCGKESFQSGSASASSFVADTLHIWPLQIPRRVYRLKECRIFVTVGGAGLKVVCGIYNYTRGQPLTLIESSECLMDASATALVTTQCFGEFEMRPEGRYMLGLTLSAAVTITTYNNTRNLAAYLRGPTGGHVAAARLPSAVPIESLTKIYMAAAVHVPDVVYFSAEGAEIL